MCERFQASTSAEEVAWWFGVKGALSHARKGDTLVVWKLDRLGRTVRQLVDFAEALKVDGVGFKSLTDSINTITPAGPFFT